tara:strand:+ start:440 stop:943 length:504 start_codon:yes stop_codon:yes gene_type:complete
MTSQIKEIMIIDNEKYTMHCTPLEPYLNILPKELKFNYRTTACWRGYIGTWYLENDQLYLINLKGTKYNTESKTLEEVGLDYLFSEQEKVFAKWYTGVLSIPNGDILKNWKDDYLSFHEYVLCLKFEKGILIDFKFVDAMEKMVNDIQIKQSVRSLGYWKKMQNWFI